MAKDLVDDLLERCGGVDDDAVRRDALLRLMPTHDASAFRRYAAAPLLVRPLVEPPMQRGKVDLEDEDGIEQTDELREVARAAAEERRRLARVGDKGLHLLDVPDVVLVTEPVHRLTGLRIAPVRQLAVAMDDVMAAALELIGD